MTQNISKLNKRIGKRLAHMRYLSGLSQSQFAEALGISRGFLSDLELGKRNLSVDTLAQICKRTGQDSTTLLGL